MYSFAELRRARLRRAVLFLVLFRSCVGDSQSAKDVLDVPVDLRGIWQTMEVLNCENFVEGMMMTMNQEHLIPTRQAILCGGDVNHIEQHIWQDCLELTITGGSAAGQAPLHHMVMDGQYVTDDYHNSGTPGKWTAHIEQPLESERMDGANVTVVFRQATGEEAAEAASARAAVPDGVARWYINGRGQLVFSQEFIEGKKGTFIMNKTRPLPCHPYDPPSCASKQYSDTSSAWTAACCEEVGNDAYGQTNAKMLPCGPAPAGGGASPAGAEEPSDDPQCRLPCAPDSCECSDVQAVIEDVLGSCDDEHPCDGSCTRSAVCLVQMQAQVMPCMASIMEHLPSDTMQRLPVLLPAIAGCPTAAPDPPSPEADSPDRPTNDECGATGMVVIHTHGDLYCELLPVMEGGDGILSVQVWKDSGAGDACESFRSISDSELETNWPDAVLVRRNGPRRFVMSCMRVTLAQLQTMNEEYGGPGGRPPPRTIGGIEFSLGAEIKETDMDQGFYQEKHVTRPVAFLWRAGRAVFELESPGGARYVMQAMSNAMDPALQLADLAGLGTRLSLPEDWTFRSYVLEEDVTVDDPVATVIQDDLENTYSKYFSPPEDAMSVEVELSADNSTNGTPDAAVGPLPGQNDETSSAAHEAFLLDIVVVISMIGMLCRLQ